MSNNGQTNYVLGFMFSKSMRHVVLIRKLRPEWQLGQCNGVGGHIEPGEVAVGAMVREFVEETGVLTSRTQWQPYLKKTGRGFCVECFTCIGNVFCVKSLTDEQVEVHLVETAVAPGFGAVEGVAWMIPMAISCLNGRLISAEARESV